MAGGHRDSNHSIRLLSIDVLLIEYVTYHIIWAILLSHSTIFLKVFFHVSLVVGPSWIGIFMKINVFLFEVLKHQDFWIRIFPTNVCGSRTPQSGDIHNLTYNWILFYLTSDNWHKQGTKVITFQIFRSTQTKIPSQYFPSAGN